MEGESMSEWKEVRLGDICNIFGRIGFRGYTINDLVSSKDEGAISLSPTNIIDGEINVDKCSYISWNKYYESPEIMIFKNDILIVKTGSSYGRTALVKEVKHQMTINPQFVVLKNININPIYLSYYIKSKTFQNQISSIVVGSAIPTLSQKNLANLYLKIQGSQTQQEIAGILSSLDAKIETNNKLNEKMEEMAQAIFKSWFVDFEPFKDKPFHDTELGMIPEGWEVKRLCDIVDNIGGYSYKGNELKESTTAMCTIKNFERNGGFKIDGYKEIIPSDKLKESQELSLFDVVVAHTDLTQNAEVIGNPAIILSKSNYDRIIFSMDLTKVISKNMNVSKSLLYCILRNKRFKNHALGYVNGTTVLHMSKKAVPDYMLAFPKDSVILASLSKCFDSIFGRMHEIYEENDRLASLRDTLLPRLMSGELIV